MINFSVALQEFELFILILVRISTFVYAAPFFNTANTPQRMKVGFSIALAMLVYSLDLNITYSYEGVLGFAGIVIAEALIGLIIGMAASMCVQIIMFAGHIMDIDMGLSMATVFDPTTKTQVGIMGNFYYYLLSLMLIVSGLYRYLISALVDTYEVIPIGGAVFRPSLYQTIVDFMGDYFVIGFRIALPMFACMLLLNCVLGVLARIAPQMNMFVLGMQLKIFVGIIVIFFTIIMLPSVSTYIFRQIRTIIVQLVNSMTPL
ncbi:MAG: flagellar biosynthetic protein FliR [Bacteroides sp.]